VSGVLVSGQGDYITIPLSGNEVQEVDDNIITVSAAFRVPRTVRKIATKLLMAQYICLLHDQEQGEFISISCNGPDKGHSRFWVPVKKKVH
jgi:hypothetical protein